MKIAKNKAISVMKAIQAANTRGRDVSFEKQRIWREINEDMLKEALELLEKGLYTVEFGVISDGKEEIVHTKKNVDLETAEMMMGVFDKHKKKDTFVRIFQQDFDLRIVEGLKTCIYERKYYGKGRTA